MEMNMTNAFANQISYSDVTPFEVVRHVSGKTVDIREMDAVRSNPENKLGFIPGGFCGECTKQHEQEWTITSNPENRVVRIRLGRKGWRDAWGNRYDMCNQPRRFYDYNF
jgi:hypothetical protein